MIEGSQTKGERLRELFDHLPDSALSVVRSGLRRLLSLSKKELEALPGRLIAAFEAGHPYPLFHAPDFAETIGFSTEQAREVNFALSFIVNAIQRTKLDELQDAELLVEIASERGLIESSQHGVFSKFTQSLIGQSMQLGESIERTQLAGRILPSFSEVHYAIDIRVQAKEDTIVRSIPVAILHIDTDLEDDYLTFQLTQSQLEGLIEKLENAKKNLRVAAGKKLVN